MLCSIEIEKFAAHGKYLIMGFTGSLNYLVTGQAIFICLQVFLQLGLSDLSG